MEYAMSQDEVSKELNMARQTIARIENKALEKFKALLEERGIKLEDLLKDEQLANYSYRVDLPLYRN